MSAVRCCEVEERLVGLTHCYFPCGVLKLLHGSFCYVRLEILPSADHQCLPVQRLSLRSREGYTVAIRFETTTTGSHLHTWQEVDAVVVSVESSAHRRRHGTRARKKISRGVWCSIIETKDVALLVSMGRKSLGLGTGTGTHC